MLLKPEMETQKAQRTPRRFLISQRFMAFVFFVFDSFVGPGNVCCA
jgi:hypothetical protein